MEQNSAQASRQQSAGRVRRGLHSHTGQMGRYTIASGSHWQQQRRRRRRRRQYHSVAHASSVLSACSLCTVVLLSLWMDKLRFASPRELWLDNGSTLGLSRYCSVVVVKQPFVCFFLKKKPTLPHARMFFIASSSQCEDQSLVQDWHWSVPCPTPIVELRHQRVSGE